MIKEAYNHITNFLDENKIDSHLTFDELLEGIEELRGRVNYNQKVYIRYKKYFEVAELIVLYWQILAIGTEDLAKNKNEISEIKQVISTFSAQISNNIVAMIELCNKGLDFQTGIIMRNHIEINTIMIYLLSDSEKRKIYLDSAKEKTDEKRLWWDNFRYKDVNRKVYEYEKETNDCLSMFYNWRRKKYNRYSKYSHNDFFITFTSSYSRAKNEKGFIHYNLFGEHSTRCKEFLSVIITLNLNIMTVFYTILKTDFVGKNKIIDKELWNMSATISRMITKIIYEDMDLLTG